jgi:hypothetical protein
VFSQHFFIDSRFVIEAFQMAGRNQPNKIAVAFQVFAKQYQMVNPLCAAGSLLPTPARDVDLATQDGFYSLGLSRLIELDRTKEIPVVGDSDGRHLLPGSLVNETIDGAGTVKQAVVGVEMKMNEFASGH